MMRLVECEQIKQINGEDLVLGLFVGDRTEVVIERFQSGERVVDFFVVLGFHVVKHQNFLEVS